MPYSPNELPLPTLTVPPTLSKAISELASVTDYGFIFVRSDGSEIEFKFDKVHAEAVKRGSHLLSIGMKKGDRLAMVVPDGDEFVLSFLGAAYVGIVPVPIYPQLSFKNIETYHDTVAHIVRASGATKLLTTASTREFVEPVRAKVDALETIFTIDDFKTSTAPEATPDVSPDDLCFLQFTSGSTSRPKGVAVTHGNLAYNTNAFMGQGLKMTPGRDMGVSWLPLFHDMGLIGFVLGPVFTKIPVVFIPTPTFVRTPRIWLDKIHQHRGTITYAPNFAYALVAKRVKEKDVKELDLSCLRAAGCGAEPIQPKTLREFADKLAAAKFVPKMFLPCYGMAEGTLAITFTDLQTGMTTDTVDSKALTARSAKKSEGEGSQELVNCGKPFEGHAIAIIDDDGKQLGDRQVGQILARGPSICAGYFNEPELTAAAFKDGWLYTGDLGYTVDGDVFICGRVKDIIIIRGRNFYPQDIEWAVSELPGIRRGNVVAFGVPVAADGSIAQDAANGEEHLVVCAEALSSEAAGLVELITQAVTATVGLATYKVEIVPQGGLPRTSSGKPQRRKTRQMFLDGTLPKARGVQNSETESSGATSA